MASKYKLEGLNIHISALINVYMANIGKVFGLLTRFELKSSIWP